MSVKKAGIIMFSALSLAALIGGCSSSTKEGGTAGTVAKVDEAACRTCHATTLEPLTGASIIAQFNNSPHVANGCQSCHGGGAQHNGVGPMPFPSPGPEQCGTCHTGQDSAEYATSKHATVATEDGEAKCNRCHTHEGAVLGMKNGFTGDQTVINAGVNAPSAIPNASVIKCATCHVMHEGKLRFDAGWAPSTAIGATVNTGKAQYKLCTGCHTYLNPDGTVVASGNTPFGTPTAKFFHNTAWNRVIASTHYDSPTTGVGLASTKIEGYVLRTSSDNPCFDCHGHEASTNTNILSRQVVNGVASYVRITPPSTTYTDWAKSAHAGGLLLQKYAAVDNYPKKADGSYDRSAGMLDAVMQAGVDGNSGAAWEHYDWDAANRQACQRCHTSTGLVAFLTSKINKTAYNAANNDFSHLSGWTTTNKTSPQNELLYCWGCHTNAPTGALRNPGAITETYGAATAGDPATTVAYPDVAGSNVCMSCHLGRETGDVIKNDQDADGVRGFVNSHYLTAGGQLFGTTGYEFTTLNYANPSYFGHDKIGTSARPGTGTNGPCVGCHMTSANKHQFTNVTKDAAGVITSLTSTTCIKCHDGAHGPALAAGNQAAVVNFLNEEREGYEAALEELRLALNAKGIYWASSNPYFFTAPYVVGGVNTSYTNWAGVYGLASWKDTMGAAFNLNLLLHDPGGYAHNRIYSKRLIYDSIDFIEDGAINGSITQAMSAKAATYLDANATTAGVQRP